VVGGQEHAVSTVKTARHSSAGSRLLHAMSTSDHPQWTVVDFNVSHDMRGPGFNQRIDVEQQQMKGSASHRGTVSSTRRNPTHTEPLFVLGQCDPPSRNSSPLEYDQIHALSRNQI
jgi:hypothetical protein